VDDLLVLALVLLLIASGYTAGRVHGQLGYREGFRSGYRQGHADGARYRGYEPTDAAPVEARLSASYDHVASESRQFRPGPRASVHNVRRRPG
jgi:hypothetical protein